MVTAREFAKLGQVSVDREESGIALTLSLFALGDIAVACQYIARARGDLNADVLSDTLVGVWTGAQIAQPSASQTQT